MKTTSLKAEMEAAFRKLPTTYEELCRVYLPRKIHDKAEGRRAKAINRPALECEDYRLTFKFTVNS